MAGKACKLGSARPGHHSKLAIRWFEGREVHYNPHPSLPPPSKWEAVESTAVDLFAPF